MTPTTLILLATILMLLIQHWRCWRYIGKMERERYKVNYSPDQFLLNQAEQYRKLWVDLKNKQQPRQPNGQFAKREK